MTEHTPNPEFKQGGIEPACFRKFDERGLPIEGKDIKVCSTLGFNGSEYTHLIINCNSMVSGNLAEKIRDIFGELVNVQILPNSDEIRVYPNLELLRRGSSIDEHLRIWSEEGY